MSSNAKTHDHKHKGLIERFPIGSILELGKHRKIVKLLASTAAALRDRLDNLEEEITAQVKAKVEQMKDQSEGEAADLEVEVNWEHSAGTDLRLDALINRCEGEPEAAIKEIHDVAWLLVQDDMQLSSEEFSLLSLSFNEDFDFLPIVTGYSPELFKKHA